MFQKTRNLCSAVWANTVCKCCIRSTVYLPWTNNFFVFSFFYVLIGALLKGMAETCLLSKDELRTPNIDEVMTV